MAWSKRLFQILFPLAFVALVLRFFFVQSFVVETKRFDPHLLYGDFIVGLKNQQPQRGDFVAFSCIHRGVCLGRLLGLPGDRLDFSKNTVQVNQKEQISLMGTPNQSDAPQPGFESTVVAPGMYFVEGDESGEISHAQIRSVLTRILISVDPDSRTLRWSRSWSAIH